MSRWAAEQPTRARPKSKPARDEPCCVPARIDGNWAGLQDVGHVGGTAGKSTPETCPLIHQSVMEFVPSDLLTWNLVLFTTCLRSASQMRQFTWRVHERDVVWTTTSCSNSCSEQPRTPRRKAFMSATMTTLQKPDGGVRGIAARTSFRRLVARTLARQFWKALKRHAPHSSSPSRRGRAQTACAVQSKHSRMKTQ